MRYCDDFILCFQYREDAQRLLRVLHQRFARYGLELHPEKTRLIEFGRYASVNRWKRGDGPPESFDFLGFTHRCGRARNGRYVTRRHTVKKRLRAKLRSIREELFRRRHEPIPVQGQWLRSVVQGYLNYHAISGNWEALETLRREVSLHWLKALRRRSQRHRLTWDRFRRYIARWLPRLRILHAHPAVRFAAIHPR